jgi:hypothetical protein
MKKFLTSLGAALGLAWFAAGCATDGRVARIQERSAAFAALTPEQKNVVSSGAIEIGYTADMVYMALGTPKRVKSKDTPDGRVEMWTYNNYYPSVVASTVSMNYPGARYTPMMNSPNMPSHGGPKYAQPASLSSTTGGLVTSVDIADLPTHTVYVFLLDGKVYSIKMDTRN